MNSIAQFGPRDVLFDVLMSREDLYDRFLQYNPAFKEFKRVLMAEPAAHALDLADVASMLDVPCEFEDPCQTKLA